MILVVNYHLLFIIIFISNYYIYCLFQGLLCPLDFESSLSLLRISDFNNDNNNC